MAENDWYADFIEEQDDKPLVAKERQEVRAGLVLARVNRAKRKKWLYWVRALSVSLGVAAILAQGPITWLMRLLGTWWKGGGQ